MAEETLIINEVDVTDVRDLRKKTALKVWENEYLDVMSRRDFARLNPRKQAEIVASSFSNFIYYGLGAQPRDVQQAGLVKRIDDAFAGKEVKRFSIRSGHGTGKTTILSWLTLYVGLTFEDSKIPMTAPVSGQLEKILIPEIKKWRNKLFPLFSNQVDVLSKDVKFKNGNIAFARTAKKENVEALAGVHASFVLYIMDEASGIPPQIMSTIEGALTGNYLLIMTSNPTRTSGFFYDSHNRDSHMYATVHLNSEMSHNVSIEWVADMRKKYGVDTDTYAVRVLGEFPKQSSEALFPVELIERAMERSFAVTDGADVYGVDVARYGDDRSVVAHRNGLKVFSLETYRGLDTYELAMKVNNELKNAEQDPDVVFVDTIGVGAGVYDSLRHLGWGSVLQEGKGSFKAEASEFLNKRAEMYFNLKKALEDGASLPKDEELREELLAINYSFSGNKQLITIEDKKLIKETIGRSPDKADAVALLFYTSVRPRKLRRRFNSEVTAVSSWESI